MTLPVQKTRRGFPLWANAAAVAAVAAGAILMAVRPEGFAADKDDPPPKAAATPLDFVPADAVAVVSVRVADLWAYPPLKAVLEKEGKDLPPLQELSTHLGLPLDEIERVTLVEESVRAEQMFIGVTTLQPYDKKAILGAVAPDAKEKDVGDRSYYDSPRGLSVAFLGGNTYLLGNPDVLEGYLKHAGKHDEGPLTPVLRLGSEKHVLIVGVDPVAIAAAAPKNAQQPEWAKPLLKARLATLTVDLDGEVKASGRMTFKNEADAKDGAAGLNDALDLARGGFIQVMKELTKGGDAPTFTALLEDAQAALRSAKAEQKGTAVEVEAALKLDPNTTQAALVEGVKKIRKESKRILIGNDLKQLALGAITYHDANGVMLPAAILDKKTGKPLLSWRVAILPYIEQGNLYNKEFHLDEPWDSDHNKKLLVKMPPQFAPPDSKAFKDHETHFQALVGKDTAFEKPGLNFPAAFTDGTSNTILFVEAKKAVPWTKPEDVELDDGKLLPKLGGLSEHGFMAALCDGSVRFFPATMKEETLRIWATRSNGQLRPFPEK